MLKTLALSELRRVAERTRIVKTHPVPPCSGREHTPPRSSTSPGSPPLPKQGGAGGGSCLERIPWRVWYVAASNGDVIAGEECITLAVELGGPGSFPSRLVQFTASGQTRRLRDCCILRADDFLLRV